MSADVIVSWGARARLSTRLGTRLSPAIEAGVFGPGAELFGDHQRRRQRRVGEFTVSCHGVLTRQLLLAGEESASRYLPEM